MPLLDWIQAYVQFKEQLSIDKAEAKDWIEEPKIEMDDLSARYAWVTSRISEHPISYYVYHNKIFQWRSSTGT